MTSRDFCYWLMGFFEVSRPDVMTSDQVRMVRNHLNLVFKHEIDPSMPDTTGELNAIHHGDALAAATSLSGLNIRC